MISEKPVTAAPARGGPRKLFLVTGFLMLTLYVFAGATVNADAAHYKWTHGLASGVELRTTGDKITSLSLESTVDCARGDSIKATGLYLGHSEMKEPLRIPVRSNGTFAFHRRVDSYGWRNAWLKGRVLNDRIVGRWFIAFYDDYYLDTCWTGKSRRNPWIQFSAKRLPKGT